MRTPAALLFLAVLVHAAWALTIPEVVDWDPAYYLDVARHIAAGHGAVTGVVWNLTWLPAQLPATADLHWMPLPSRVLVPGVWLWSAHGAQAVTVLVAATWAPVAWATARDLGLDSRSALIAGIFAAFAGGYARFLSTPDSIAIYGLVGALAVGFAVRAAWVPAALLAGLAALTRGDGFLLAPCLALGFRGWRAVVVATSGPLATAAWYLRCLHLGGDDWLVSRAATSRAMTYSELVSGTVGDPTVADRVRHLASQLPGLLVVALLAGVFLLPWPALAEAWRRRRQRVVHVAGAYFLAVLFIPVLAAPAVGGSGSPFRSWSALFPLLCALAAGGLARAGDWGHRARGYPRWFLPGLVGAGVVVGSIGIGGSAWKLGPKPDFDCVDLPEGPLLAADPLLVTGRCGIPAVVLPRDAAPAQVSELCRRYGIEHALLADPDDSRADLARPEDAGRLLPGWSPVSAPPPQGGRGDERLYRAPDLR